MQAGKTAFDKLDLVGDEATGANIVKVALDAPLRQIAVNAGLEGGVVVEKVRNLEAGHGLNAATGEYVDMLAAGIIDPAKVTRSALQNAASIAALFLTTEAVVADKPEKNPAPRPAPGRRRHGLLSPAPPDLRVSSTAETTRAGRVSGPPLVVARSSGWRWSPVRQRVGPAPAAGLRDGAGTWTGASTGAGGSSDHRSVKPSISACCITSPKSRR